MALSTLTARVEDYDKVAFDDFCSSVGLTTSAAINLYVKVVVRDRKIPFEIKQEEPFYSAGNRSHLLKSIRQLEEGKGTVHELVETENE
jgi:DNA-damage-inducible protein J